MTAALQMRAARPVGHLSQLPIQLERLPFGSLDPNARIDQLSLRFSYGGTDATWHASALNAEGGPALLPGPFGNDVWVALGRVCNDLKLRERDVSDPEVRTITLGYLDLLRLMEKTPSQTVYDALEATVERLGSVSIVAQGTWKDGEYIRERLQFPLFEATRILTRRDGDGSRNLVTFRLSLEVAKAFVQHSRLLNTRELYRLKSSTGRRLYRVLEAERYNRDRQGARLLTLTLSELQIRLPLLEKKHTHLKRRLGRAHAELQSAGLLASEPTYTVEKLAGVRAPTVSVTYQFPPASLPRLIEGESAAEQDANGKYAGRQQLADFLGVTAAASTSRPVSDLAWWVGEIEQTLGDRRSSGFYKQVVEAFAGANALDALEFVLRGVQRDGVGSSPKALGAAFTARLKARAAELHIALPGTASASKRGTGVVGIRALLSGLDDSPVPNR